MRPNSAVIVCGIAALVFAALALLFLGGRQYKFALGAAILCIASTAFGLSEIRHMRRDQRLHQPPFTTSD